MSTLVWRGQVEQALVCVEAARLMVSATAPCSVEFKTNERIMHDPHLQAMCETHETNMA